MLHKILLTALLSSALTCSAAPPLQLKDGDRVALIGNTFIEREPRYGHIEAALTLAEPDATFTFRNLGWSGDNVFGESRAFFGPPHEGYQHLMNHVAICKPTVILINYGANAAFEGEAGLKPFTDQYGKLVDDFKKRTPRIVLIAPAASESLGAPLPDMSSHNQDLATYTAAIQQLATEKQIGFYDLFTDSKTLLEDQPKPLTDNGIHFTDEGYRLLAPLVAKGLTGKNPDFGSFATTKAYPDMMHTIFRKNRLFFHRHRPQNETYLRGFRKHEQGQNAKEIAEFDPLTDKLDGDIAEKRTRIFQQAIEKGGKR